MPVNEKVTSYLGWTPVPGIGPIPNSNFVNYRYIPFRKIPVLDLILL